MRIRTKPSTVTVELDGGARFTFRPLTAGELGRLAREHTTVEHRRGRVHERLDAAAFGRAVWLAQVVGWDGLEDEDGAPLAYSREAAELVWEHNADVATEALERLDEALRARDDLQKNA